LAVIDSIIDVSYSHESYEDTATRMCEEGDYDLGEIYEALEKKWHEIEERQGS